MTGDVPVRDAATVILVRDPGTAPRVLMGQRGKTAAFMPERFVFPGGAVDALDAGVAFAQPLCASCRTRLAAENATTTPEALAAAAIRELWEETGQCLARPGGWDDVPAAWTGFGARGLRPDASGLHFFFRAITPPGRPRRFDARFFVADAAGLATDPDDFAEAEDELAHLHWVGLDDAQALRLPSITRTVLTALARHLPSTGAPDRVPFVRNDDMENGLTWL